MSTAKEAHSHSHGHGHPHHSSQSSAFMAERLLELKNSDPELFSQAWSKIPQSTQENILAYLKKHGSADRATSHQGFEDKHQPPGKHRNLTEEFENARLERSERESKNPAPQSVVETRRAGPILGRPLYEWTDGELLSHTFLDAEAKESPTGHGKEEESLQIELRRLSKQNMVQIVQNELIRRLLQTIAGKA